MKKEHTFECNKCDEIFVTNEEFKDHREAHVTNNPTIQCDVCGKIVNEEWKMRAHRKMHADHECSVCEKKFKYQETKSKHMRIAHENLKLFCHFFNNKKTCPFSKDCIFLHEDAPMCKYGKKCKRIYCMFKHEDVEVENVDTNEITEIENVDEDSQKEKSDVIATEDFNVQETFDVIEVTENDDLIETVTIVEAVKCDIVDEIETVCVINIVEETVNEQLPPVKRRKCLMCDYEATTGAEITQTIDT